MKQQHVHRLGAVSDEELAVALEDVVQRLGDGEGPKRQQVGRRQRDLADAGPPCTGGRPAETEESCEPITMGGLASEPGFLACYLMFTR